MSFKKLVNQTVKQ